MRGQTINFITSNIEKTWAVVVAHLAERRRLMPEVRIYLLLTVLERQNKEKEEKELTSLKNKGKKSSMNETLQPKVGDTIEHIRTGVLTKINKIE